ncbi:MAG: hypothetical protein LCH84_08995 [Gemmatimonadetes bacterium]|nr:hypothetical protein [Gemmatimonadota bacterium]
MPNCSRLRRVRLLLALSAATVLATPPMTAHAQDPRAASTKAATDAMARFAWMAGAWEGPASVQNAGRTFTLTQREEVRTSARGTALIIEGRGSMRMAPDQPEREVFAAAGVLTYDATTSRYKFFSASGSGQAGESQIEPLGPDGLVWGFSDAQGHRTRYTITRTSAGAWHELGETSTDGGTTWTKIMEMTLTKRP